MIEEKRNELNDKRLKELDPFFALKIEQILMSLESFGWQPFIASAYRTSQEQQKKVQAKRSRILKSKHCAMATDGRPAAQAVDIVDSRWAWSMPEEEPEQFNDFLRDIEYVADENDLGWGGNWKKAFPPYGDWAHIETK